MEQVHDGLHWQVSSYGSSGQSKPLSKSKSQVFLTYLKKGFKEFFFFSTQVRRFSDAFFLVENPRSAVFECAESKYQQYASLVETLRTSRYLSLLPKLPVSCLEIDGDANSLPVIFEDVYRDEHATWGIGGRRHSYNDLSSLEEDQLLSIGEVLAAETSLNDNKVERRKQPRPSSVPSSKKWENNVSSKSFFELQRTRMCGHCIFFLL